MTPLTILLLFTNAVLLAALFWVRLRWRSAGESRETAGSALVDEELRRNEARLRVMLEQLPAVVWTTDRHQRFTSSVGVGLAGLGLKPNEAVGQSLFEYFGTEDEEFPPIAANRRALAGESVAYELEWAGQSYHSLVEPLRDVRGDVVGTVGVALDVTEARDSERALRDSEERYRGFLTHTAEGIFRFELESPIDVELSVDEQVDRLYRNIYLAECNDAYARMCGEWSAVDLLGVKLDRILPESAPANREKLRAFIESGHELSETEIERLDRNGRTRHYEMTLTGIVEDGQLLRIWGTQRDVTAHKRAEQAVRASEERYRELFEESLDTLFISTVEGHLVDINPAGLRLLGYRNKKELLQVDIEQELYLNPEDRARAVELLHREGSVRDFEIQLKRKDGTVLVVLETTSAMRDPEGRVYAFRGMLRDVTQQRALEEQLLRSQRMEAVGRMAGGVAHDFNNLLTVINGRSDLLRLQLEPGSPLAAEVDEIKAAGERAAALTRQLLVLSRRRLGQPQAINVNKLVTSMENLLRRSVGERTELVTRLDSNLANIKADPGQLEQVILNLALNARDAMPHGGRLVIVTANATIEPASSLTMLGLKPGPYVSLRVEDTGVGIDPNIRGQIFEPFFSTKDPAEGTGLGLSTVYGIVHQCGGHVRVESEPGRGARFEIYLPAVAEAVEEPAEKRTKLVSPGGSETILLVEDEAAVRGLLRRFLDSQGYRVLEAADGEEALRIANTGAESIDLLLTDLVMPGLGGFELARRLKAAKLDLEILYMSGYSEGADGFLDSGLVADPKRFLQKPFSTDVLAHRLREILGSG
jgi:PAS domain S-box-containing protein